VKDVSKTAGLPSDEDLLETFNTRISDAIDASETWRTREVAENFALFEGDQWAREALDRQVNNAMPAITINRTSPVLESICGFEINNRLEVDYAPRLINGAQESLNDAMNDTVDYIKENTHARYQESLAFKDMTISGVGCTDTMINYDNNEDGEAIVERVFPGFLLWDIGARAKNILDADWVCKIKIIDRDKIYDEYGLDESDTSFDNAADGRLIEFFNASLAVQDLGIIYEYQWREKKDFYRCENPLRGIDAQSLGFEMQQMLVSLNSIIQERFGFEIVNEENFTLDSKMEVNELKEILEIGGFDLKYSSQKKYKYYRAIISGDKVIKKAENYSQKGFSLKFMTGQFSETEQMYYGLGRPCKHPQRLLNQAVSDYVGFLQTSPKGGVNIEVDAVNDIQGFIRTYSKAREVTVFQSGALQSGKVQPKITPPIPAGILEMIQFADNQIMQVCGVTPELMGMMDTKEMNTSFYKQQIKQAQTTLATYFDAKSLYMRHQGTLYIDCVRVLVENNPKIIERNVTGDNAEGLMLTQSTIAQEYDIRLQEKPDNDDENHDTFLKLLDMQTQMPDKQIMPLALEYSNFDKQLKEKLLAAIAPPPPPEPDPLNQAILESEINYKNASAERLKADAYDTTIDARLKEVELMTKNLKEETEIAYDEARTKYELSKTYKNIQ
jgi:hypothetical protein